MPIESEIYDRLVAQLGSTVDAVYDSIRPDGQVLVKPVVVFTPISSAPDTNLAGEIAFNYPEFQVSVFCAKNDLNSGRSVRAAIIAALHNYRTATFKAVRKINEFQFEPTAEIPEWHIPIDFRFTTA